MSDVQSRIDQMQHLPVGADHSDPAYMGEVECGKSLLQLVAVREELQAHPYLRGCWHAATFTAYPSSVGEFDAIETNIAYHFHKHGQRYGSVRIMTDAALQYYRNYKTQGVGVTLRDGSPGTRLPNGSLYTDAGKIVTYWP